MANKIGTEVPDMMDEISDVSLFSDKLSVLDPEPESMRLDTPIVEEMIDDAFDIDEADDDTEIDESESVVTGEATVDSEDLDESLLFSRQVDIDEALIDASLEFKRELDESKESKISDNVPSYAYTTDLLSSVIVHQSDLITDLKLLVRLHTTLNGMENIAIDELRNNGRVSDDLETKIDALVAMESNVQDSLSHLEERVSSRLQFTQGYVDSLNLNSDNGYFWVETLNRYIKDLTEDEMSLEDY